MQKEWLIGRGKEHNVYREPDSNYVVKIPRRYHMAALNALFEGPQTVVNDLIETQKLVRETEGKVQLPETLVLFTHKGYEMHQRYIEDDSSVQDVPERLRALDQPYLAGRAMSSRDNFAVEKNGETIYILDPTLFLLSRLFKEHPKTEKAWRTFLRGKNKLKNKIKNILNDK